MKNLYTFFSIFYLFIFSNYTYTMQKNENSKKLCRYIISDSKIEEVKKILVEGQVDLNFNCSNNQTPLHIACQMGNFLGVKALLDYYEYTLSIPPYNYPVDVNAKDKDGNTPLVYAIIYNRINSINALLDDKHHKVDLNIQNNKKDTTLNILLKTKKIDFFNKIKLVRKFIELGSNPNIKNHNGNTALHIATLFGNKDLVKTLILSYRNIDINSLNNKGRTPIYLAAEMGKVDILEELLNFKADVNIQDVYSLAPLTIAVLNKHVNIVKGLLNPELITPVNINLITDNSIKSYNKRFPGGETALHFAYYTDSKEIIDLLIKNNIDQEIKNRNGLTARKFYEHILDSDKNSFSSLSNTLSNLKAID